MVRTAGSGAKRVGGRPPWACRFRRSLQGGAASIVELRNLAGSRKPQPAAHLVFVHDGVGVPAGDAGAICEPVGALLPAQEHRTGFEPIEPLGEAVAGYGGDACDEARVQIRAVD